MRKGDETMKKKYFAPTVEVVPFGPEIMDGIIAPSVGVGGAVEDDPTGTGSWENGGDGDAGDIVGAKGANLWDGWDD